jgi:hypothetical protein
MEVDYSPFLHVLEDGSIWWPREDAIKLGAGYLPMHDDNVNLVPVLLAKNNRVRANERTLIGALSPGRSNVVLPRILKRDDGLFVEAHEFLGWLSRYVAEDKGFPFPNDLARAVSEAPGSSAGRWSAQASFESLSAALEGWFEKPLAELPGPLRSRVDAEYPLSWDLLTSDQRQGFAGQWDAQHDPALESERKYWWDFYLRKGEIEKQIEKWSAVETPTAIDLAQKETRLAELKRELAGMEQKERQAPGGRPNHLRPDAPHLPGRPKYIAIPIVRKLLADRLGAAFEEMAAWVWLGPKIGGLAAYVNVNELEPPPRFYFDYYMGDNYLDPLMACWFKEEDIVNFAPKDRFITGMALIDRWRERLGNQTEAFIRAKITESRLQDMHPIKGGTQWSFGRGYPPKKTALFELSRVKEIEETDFYEGKSDEEAVAARTIGRNKELQDAANKLARQWRTDNRKTFSKREIAKELAKSDEWKDMTAVRIERLILVKW